MRSFIFPLLYILCANATTVAIFKKKFGNCLPITLLFSAFPLFFSALLFNTFRYGIIFNIIYACLFIFILRRKDFVKNYFSNGFFACLFLYVIVFIININRDFSEWDEFSHWGTMVKEMFRLDNFYSVNKSTLMLHKDYPPIVPLFELFWTKICGMYSETCLLTSLKFLMLSFLIPVIEHFKSKNKIQILVQTLIIILIVTFTTISFDYDSIYNTLYIDFFISFISCYLLFDIFINDDLLSPFSLVKYCIVLSFFLLTKQICLPLYFMVLFMFVGKVIINRKKLLNDKKVLKILCILVFIIIIPISNLLIWNRDTTKYDVDRQFVISNIEITKLPSIINRTAGNQYQPTIANFFIDALYSIEITSSIIRLSYIQCGILVIVLMYLIYRKFRKVYNKKEYILLSTSIALGYIGYAFVLLYLYVFCFYIEEGLTMASFERYMSTYALVMLLLCVVIYIYGLYKTQDYNLKKPLTLLLILLMLLPPHQLREMELYGTLNISNDEYKRYATYLKKNVPEGAKVFQIAQYFNNDSSRKFFEERKYQYYVHYYANDLVMNNYNNNFDVSANVKAKDYFDKNIKSKMMNYDYVYLLKINDAFVAKYDFLFEDPTNIKSGNIYKIIKNSDEILLREIDYYEK